MLKQKFPVRFLTGFIILFSIPTVLSANFDSQLERIGELWKRGAHETLAPLLQGFGPSPVLEDLRLYILGESLRNCKREIEAAKIFEKVIGDYPETLGGKKALFPYILCAAKTKGTPATEMLLRLAKSLPSSYQRGRAIQELAGLQTPGTRERSRLSLESLREYHSDAWFYKSVPESRDLIKQVLSEFSQHRFSRDEWIEIVIMANREDQATSVSRILPFLKPALGPAPDAATLVLQADVCRAMKQKERAAQILASLLNSKSVEPGIRALAFQVRGDLFTSENRHENAASDYTNALEWPKPPVDVVAARYRLMRSAFEAGLSKKSLESAEILCREFPGISLLPAHLYEMGLGRFDSGRMPESVPFFLLLAKYFPGNYRADDGLGYAAIASNPDSPEGKKIIAGLRKFYPHSFFLYWLDPAGRKKPFACPVNNPAVPGFVKNRLPAWRILLRSSFGDLAREEIRQLQDEHSVDLGLFKTIGELYLQVGDYNQVTACGERLLKNFLDSGKSADLLPAWHWHAYFPRPYWEKITSEAQRNRLDPYWIISIMREESHFNPQTLSRSNAMCLMQILPSTGKWIAGKMGIKGKFQKESLWNIDRNISFGAWYLAYLSDLFKGDLFLAAASYNGGQGNITRKVEQGPFAGLPVLSRLDKVPLPETRDYYKKVMSSWWCYKRLYEKGM